MVIKYMKRTCTSLLMTLMVILPVYGEENPQPCDVNHQISLVALVDMDLSSYEKESIILSLSAEGTPVDYYYDEGILKAIVARFYGHAGRTERAFYFESRENYLVDVTRYFYTWPPDYDTRKRSIVGTYHARFVVCQNRLWPSFVYGGYEPMDTHYNNSSGSLETLLEHDPRGN
ncbi:MAG: hypothetical protein ACR2PR_12235 [Pseudohongiellaceae bacterium]